MAVSKTKPQHNPDVIYIERRETVAIIAPSQNGERSMLEEAFLQAGRFIAEEARTDREIELQWRYGGGVFRASHHPIQLDQRPDHEGYEDDD